MKGEPEVGRQVGRVSEMQYVQGETYMFGRGKGVFKPRCLIEKWTHTRQNRGNTEEPLNWQYDLSPSSPLYPSVSQCHFILSCPPCLIENLNTNTLVSEMLPVTVKGTQGGSRVERGNVNSVMLGSLHHTTHKQTHTQLASDNHSPRSLRL